MTTKPDKATIKSRSSKVLRFAHPFYTDIPPEARPVVSGIGQRMTDYVVTKLEPVPAPQRDTAMQLEEIIGINGAAEVMQAGALIFHATGDTGQIQGDLQQVVADAMTADYTIQHPGKSPAFFLHLGDVNYYNNNDKG
ncbi:MAG: hypothetical protein H0X41_12020, partial [Chitinophagaceae bacterium]|nr:hypothetical protein [Chitinophagaceae bacterium]